MATRVNARRSTGPRTLEGKHRSRCNALRHGLTAETVITALENAADYQAFEASIASDYQPRSASERELVWRLASLLWRLRRSSAIETGLFQIQADLLQDKTAGVSHRRRVPLPEWYDELDVGARAIDGPSISPRNCDDPSGRVPTRRRRWPIASSGSVVWIWRLRSSQPLRAALWRQAAQLLFMLQSAARR